MSQDVGGLERNDTTASFSLLRTASLWAHSSVPGVYERLNLWTKSWNEVDLTASRCSVCVRLSTTWRATAGACRLAAASRTLTECIASGAREATAPAARREDG